MTLLFILPELPDSSFLESSILRKKKTTTEVLNIPTLEGIYLMYWTLQCCISDSERNCGRQTEDVGTRMVMVSEMRIWCHADQIRKYGADLPW